MNIFRESIPEFGCDYRDKKYLSTPRSPREGPLNIISANGKIPALGDNL